MAWAGAAFAGLADAGQQAETPLYAGDFLVRRRAGAHADAAAFAVAGLVAVAGAFTEAHVEVPDDGGGVDGVEGDAYVGVAPLDVLRLVVADAVLGHGVSFGV